ncbi:hypothetical protein D3C73_902400 [compost metagenome]
MPLREAREAATSQGGRTGLTTTTPYPAALRRLRQNGNRRQTRGSLSTMVEASPNSSCRSSTPSAIRSGRLLIATPPSARQSCQFDDSRPSRRSLKSATAVLSQNPFGLSVAAGMRRLGAAPPARTSAPATEEVPLRCMPRTIRADFAVMTGISRRRWGVVCSAFKRAILALRRARGAG